MEHDQRYNRWLSRAQLRTSLSSSSAANLREHGLVGEFLDGHEMDIEVFVLHGNLREESLVGVGEFLDGLTTDVTVLVLHGDLCQ